ncbi:hypothetical protein B7939_00915 [Eggerthia catenaformis]|nr:hypothetical protein B7939_00915 [Eggerthia catenaformis]
MKFNSEKEMIAFLRSYRNSYYEWIALEASINVKSPMFSDFPSDFDYSDKVSTYNRDIVRKEELETQMREISDIIELLRDVNQDYYRTLYFKFIKFKTLEEIACMIHVSERTMYRLYRSAKKALFFKLST